MHLSCYVEYAKEEITHCNIELHWFHTAIIHKGILLCQVLQHIKAENHAIYEAVETYISHHLCINNQVLVFIIQTHSLDDFSGDKTFGRQIGVDDVSKYSNRAEPSDVDSEDNDDLENWLDIEDNELGDIVGNIAKYISDL
ncbi:hypothetical protein J3R82DRAFT_1776 [Butyriboletus roseoflavus]|nr:hypothetical protein J3R82DRAFT_1776 [Butyriboletus roseoflavus]